MKTMQNSVVRQNPTLDLSSVPTEIAEWIKTLIHGFIRKVSRSLSVVQKLTPLLVISLFLEGLPPSSENSRSEANFRMESSPPAPIFPDGSEKETGLKHEYEAMFCGSIIVISDLRQTSGEVAPPIISWQVDSVLIQQKIE